MVYTDSTEKQLINWTIYQILTQVRTIILILKQLTPISYVYAVNNTSIPVYGTVTLELNLGLRRPFLWTFLIADIDRPILGIDFLSHFDLLISPFRRIVIDQETGLEVKCEVEYSPSSELSAIPPTNDEFYSLLKLPIYIFGFIDGRYFRLLR